MLWLLCSRFALFISVVVPIRAGLGRLLQNMGCSRGIPKDKARWLVLFQTYRPSFLHGSWRGRAWGSWGNLEVGGCVSPCRSRAANEAMGVAARMKRKRNCHAQQISNLGNSSLQDNGVDTNTTCGLGSRWIRGGNWIQSHHLRLMHAVITEIKVVPVSQEQGRRWHPSKRLPGEAGGGNPWWAEKAGTTGDCLYTCIPLAYCKSISLELLSKLHR